MTRNCDLLIKNVHVATFTDNGHDYGALENAAIAVVGRNIAYVGPLNDCPFASDNTIDGQGGWVTPGLIDCHTHLVYGGDRAKEFEQRLLGVSYKEIAEAGGGINSTVMATRQATHEELLASATKRAARLLEEGVTTIEVKSGYGLDLDNEVKMLEVARDISKSLPVNIETTFLGAHTVPPEYKGRADAYIDYLCDDVIPVVANKRLAGCVDVFCESIGFSPEQSRRIFQCAAEHGLKIKAHVEQLSDLKGAVLACEFNALSVDHIEYLDPKDIHHIKAAGTVAVILPGAFYYLHETQKPPIAPLRQHQVPMAIATDLNPGSSPLASLLTAMNMASVLFSLTPEEALRGTTVNAAKALGLDNKGQLAAGMDADLCLWDIDHPSELVYAINQHRPADIWIGGKHVER